MSRVHKHNGIYAYDGGEVGNVVLGQNGYDIMLSLASSGGRRFIAGQDGVNDGLNTFYPYVRYWVSIKAMNGDVCSVTAKSLQGDDLALNGIYTTIGSTHNIDLQPDDVINGCFSEIRVCDSTCRVQAMRG